LQQARAQADAAKVNFDVQADNANRLTEVQRAYGAASEARRFAPFAGF
jgi:hypothetical protein